MKIINPGKEDFHTHTVNYSDGLNTVDELMIFAGKFGLETLGITDHCQEYLNRRGFGRRSARSAAVKRWKNIHNDVNVIFGVEGDILDENGNISADIDKVESDLMILSTHNTVYSGDPKKITDAYINAIKKHSDKITMLGHPCSIYFDKTINIKEITKAANDYGIPMEFNCANFVNKKTNMKNLETMFTLADKIYVNSDAHTLNELGTAREEGFNYLKKQRLLK